MYSLASLVLKTNNNGTLPNARGNKDRRTHLSTAAVIVANRIVKKSQVRVSRVKHEMFMHVQQVTNELIVVIIFSQM